MSAISTTKQPYLVVTEAYILPKELYIRPIEPCKQPKQPCLVVKEAYILPKESTFDQ